jgi:hypothetical protein
VSHFMAVAFPIVPGQEDRVRNFGQEVAQHQEEWERLNREAGGFTAFHVVLEEWPGLTVAIHSWEVEDPSKMRTAFIDSPHDAWWLDYLRDVHGIDLRNWPADQPPPTPPPLVFEWKA